MLACALSNATPQQARVADAASGERDHGDFGIWKRSNVVPFYRGGAANARALGRTQPVTDARSSASSVAPAAHALSRTINLSTVVRLSVALGVRWSIVVARERMRVPVALGVRRSIILAERW